MDTMNAEGVNMPSYDSTADTLAHIKKVANYLMMFATHLLQRAQVHDNSKLVSPEKELFDEYTPKLAGVTFGSDEYRQFLVEMKPALDHHYANNTHHPEHYKRGVNEMNLVDLVEMLLDWKAASERHNDGNIRKSISHNREKFGISDQLAEILDNTVNHFGW